MYTGRYRIFLRTIVKLSSRIFRNSQNSLLSIVSTIFSFWIPDAVPEGLYISLLYFSVKKREQRPSHVQTETQF